MTPFPEQTPPTPAHCEPGLIARFPGHSYLDKGETPDPKYPSHILSQKSEVEMEEEIIYICVDFFFILQILMNRLLLSRPVAELIRHCVFRRREQEELKPLMFMREDGTRTRLKL